MDLQLSGKRAIVTGGSRGIGLAVATALVAEGARVAVVARDAEALAAAAAPIGAEPFAADTGSDSSVRSMVASVAEGFGGVDVLVNAAARPASAGTQVAASATSDDVVREEFEVKVLGYLRCARAVAPHMTAQGWGRIVNISGLNARRSTSLVGSVRNVAVASMTSALAAELGPHGVNVTVVHPGITVTEKTPATLAAIAAAQDISEEEALAGLAAGTTIGRLVTAAEVADVVTFLCSPRSVAVNGDAVAVGGGVPGVTYY
jgi:NAD(P)-dependent dehydrogenase (short-subunit alcohol dehydrogenase family)